MNLFEKYLREATEKMAKEKIALRVLGDQTPLSPGIRRLIQQTQALNETFEEEMTANLCINYGGRNEILRACRTLAHQCRDGAIEPEAIDEGRFSDALYTAGIPDPDLVIRPSGEVRLSNFLLWQCAYAEFYFTDTLWPDFDEREMQRALQVYGHRNRRFGGVKA